MGSEYKEPVVEQSVFLSIEQLRKFCRVPINEREEDRSGRLSQQVAEFMELFGLPSMKTRKGLFDLFRVLDNKTDLPVLRAMREYLRMELGRLQDVINQHLEEHDDLDDTLRQHMELIELIRRSEIMVSRPRAMKSMSCAEVKESLAGSCVTPRSHLKDPRALRYREHVFLTGVASCAIPNH